MKLPALAFALLLASAAAVAQEQRPDELVRKVTADVLSAVQSDKVLASGDRKKALELAETKILPHVDFREAARLVGYDELRAEQRARRTRGDRRLLGIDVAAERQREILVGLGFVKEAACDRRCRWRCGSWHANCSEGSARGGDDRVPAGFVNDADAEVGRPPDDVDRHHCCGDRQWRRGGESCV